MEPPGLPGTFSRMTSGPTSGGGGRRPERRRWPKILLGTIAAVLIVSFGVGGFVWWKTAPPPPVNAMPILIEAREALQPPGDHQDAWPGYAAFFQETLGMEYLLSNGNEAMQLIRKINFLSALMREVRNAEPNNEEARAALRTLQPVLDQLMEVADTPLCRWPVRSYEEPLDAASSHTPIWADEIGPAEPFLLIHFQAMLLFSAEIAYQQGEIADGNARLRAANHVAMHMHQSALDSLAFGIIWRTLSFDLVRNMAATHELTEVQADDTLRVLRESPDHIELSPVYLTQAVVHAAHIGSLIANPITDIASLENWRRVFTWPSPRWTAIRIRNHFQKLATIADVPFSVRPDIPEYPRDDLSDADQFAAYISTRDRCLSVRAATIIILLLERHHAATGEWPAALEDIMPREETLDPNTLTPFVYTRTPDGPSPFSLLAPPEAEFIPAEQRDFTKPREPIAVQNRGRQPPR